MTGHLSASQKGVDDDLRFQQIEDDPRDLPGAAIGKAEDKRDGTRGAISDSLVAIELLFCMELVMFDSPAASCGCLTECR